MLDVKEVLKSYKNPKRDSLIPILQDIQEQKGYLCFDDLLEVSKTLDLALSKVYGVASFYNQFKFNKPGKHHIQVCRGTACHVKGSLNVLSAVKRLLNINEDETTKDGLFSLEVVSCVGACSLAPVICIDGNYYAQVDSKKIENILKKYREEDKQNGK